MKEKQISMKEHGKILDKMQDYQFKEGFELGAKEGYRKAIEEIEKFIDMLWDNHDLGEGSHHIIRIELKEMKEKQ